MYQIGELSARTDVPEKTIRYYEAIGLLPPAKRGPNGYRLYDDANVERLRFIHRARILDFALDEITEILAFRERNEPPCRYVMELMHEQIDKVEERIRSLQQIRDELKALYEAGKQLPEDVQMRGCVCHLIQVGINPLAGEEKP
jgi:DNA-binding transcriptional MerR regulator